MELLYLPLQYLILLIIAGLISGAVLKLEYRQIGLAFLLFTLFAIQQFTFRVNEDVQPNRIPGQIIYYGIFLASISTAQLVKQKLKIEFPKDG